MTTESEQFNQAFDDVYEEKAPDFSKSVNIVVIGKVSAGKSSLINAILGYKRDDKESLKVSAVSGVTTKLKFLKLGDNVLIIDSPGLGDVKEENSEVTNNFLQHIDIGLFVIHGSADASQKKAYDDLKKNTERVIVVLNKIHDYNGKPSAYEKVVEQWKNILDVDKIYGTCADGYDVDDERPDTSNMRQGIQEVRDEILDFLKTQGKDILLARHLKDKSYYSNKIIAGALMLVAGEAFIPGSAVYITTTQVLTIVTLHYLYKGQALSKSTALSLVGIFGSQSIGMSAFLAVKSLLPPTGVVDVAAALVAVTVTFAVLSTVRWALEKDFDFSKDHELDNLKKLLKEQYKEFLKVGEKLKYLLKDLSIDDLKNKDLIMKIIMNFLTK